MTVSSCTKWVRQVMSGNNRKTNHHFVMHRFEAQPLPFCAPHPPPPSPSRPRSHLKVSCPRGRDTGTHHLTLTLSPSVSPLCVLEPSLTQGCSFPSTVRCVYCEPGMMLVLVLYYLLALFLCLKTLISSNSIAASVWQEECIITPSVSEGCDLIYLPSA